REGIRGVMRAGGSNMRDLEDSRVQLAVRGRVYLVGAGPGDPSLLTMRAYRLLSTARVVAYDELVSDEILALAPPDAVMIPAGGGRGRAARVPSERTVVLYMGLAPLAETAAALIARGRAPTTPAAVVSHATLPTEKTVVSDLANIAAAAAGLEAPALVIVGDV